MELQSILINKQPNTGFKFSTTFYKAFEKQYPNTTIEENGIHRFRETFSRYSKGMRCDERIIALVTELGSKASHHCTIIVVQVPKETIDYLYIDNSPKGEVISVNVCRMYKTLMWTLMVNNGLSNGMEHLINHSESPFGIVSKLQTIREYLTENGMVFR